MINLFLLLFHVYNSNLFDFFQSSVIEVARDVVVLDSGRNKLHFNYFILIFVAFMWIL